MSERIIELKPIKESAEDFDVAEARIKALFKREIYFPLLRQLGESSKVIQNAKDALADALRSGRVTFSRGQFSGQFNAGISKQLKEMGATWDRKNASWKIPKASLPREVQEAISVSEFRFKEKIDQIDKKLAQILPEEIADKIKLSDTFDRALWRTEKGFEASVKGITVPAQITAERRKKIADEWENNFKLYIKDFTQEETTKLRKNLKKAVFAGNRYEAAISTIQKSYGVSASKAKFLARQETSLLMTTYKEARYTDSGIEEYRWGCVHKPKDKSPSQHIPGNVRYYHGLLDGRIFRFSQPPVVDQHGNRKNPGADYNCRCFARPIVRF